jgi:membrane associated rhomboid family serine protease
MRNAWQRFLAVLTPGVRVLLCLLAAVYLVAVIGRMIHAVDLYGWLALSGPDLWRGQVWRLVTYALLPAGIMDFVMNAIALVILGGLLERHWSRGQLWLYCLVVVAGAGAAKVLLQFSNPMPLTGAAPMMFGLLIAWGFLCGHEVINLVVFGQMTVWKLVLGAAVISLFIMVLTGGLGTALILAAGGLTGWLYLRLTHKWLMSRASRINRSERISRLEL